MYHSVIFGDKNTWDDWHLVPESRPVFLPPDVKTNYVDIPGADGHLDLTEALVGEPLYKNRSDSITFYVANGYWSWEEAYSTIMNYLHGQKMRAYLEDDPGFYYEGRFSVNTWRSEKHRSEIVINYDISPYKIDMYSSKDDWLWDPFNFNIGIVRDYSNIRIDGTVDITMYGSRKTVMPKFIVTLDNPDNPMSVSWSEIPNKNYPLTAGEYKIPDVKIKNTVTTLTFKGKGIISIDYRGGSL